MLAFVGFGTIPKLVTRINEGELNVSQRPIGNDLTTLTGRTLLYAAVPQVFINDPIALLRGYDSTGIMPIVRNYTERHIGYSHMHNSFLQTLMITGLPGLVLAVWLTLRIVSSAAKLLLINDGSVSAAQKLTTLIPMVLLLQGMLEAFLFVDTFSIINLMFLLLSGYVIQLGKGLTWQQVLPRKAREQQR